MIFNSEVTKNLIENTKDLPNNSQNFDKRIDVKSINKNFSNTLEKNANIDNRISIKKDNLETSKADINEHNSHLGGKYVELQKSDKYNSHKHEIHHIPADSTNELKRNDGPAIIMDKEDHRQTASCGNSKEAIEYRHKQSEYIENGQYDKAVEMDVKDLKDKFGDKYNRHISEMKEYIKQLKKDGKL